MKLLKLFAYITPTAILAFVLHWINAEWLMNHLWILGACAASSVVIINYDSFLPSRQSKVELEEEIDEYLKLRKLNQSKK